MTGELQVHFRNYEAPASILGLIQRRVEKLDAICPQIVRCDISVDVPHRRHRKGRRFSVRVDLGVPGSELVARNRPDHASSEQLSSAISEAFRASERQLRDFVAVNRRTAR